MYDRNLIYDVGMFNGDDTNYYLHRGYRVVAVEANPEMAENGRRRFADAIRAGRLTIVEAAIAPEPGIVEMVVDETLPERNTLNPHVQAGWVNTTTHTIQVRAIRFRDVLAEHGVPAYLKIDIETYDRYCLEDLDPADLPPYVSFESLDIRELFLVHEKGYREFKIIRQQDHHQAHFDIAEARAAMYPAPRPSGLASLVRSLMLSARSRNRAPAGRKTPDLPPHYQPHTDWQFQPGQSGPFAEDTEGDWRTYYQAVLTFLAYEMGLKNLDYPAGRWHDVHCRTPMAAANPIYSPHRRPRHAAA